MTANLACNDAAVIAKIKRALALPWVQYDFDALIADMQAGRLQAFWNDDAVVLTEICVSPRRTFLNVVLAAGDMAGVVALQPQVVSFARAQGIQEAQGTMRPGWAKLLKKRGWRKWAEIWNFPKEQWDG